MGARPLELSVAQGEVCFSYTATEIVVIAAMRSLSSRRIHTGHADALLHEAYVFPGVLREIVEAPGGRRVTVPAWQRLVLDLRVQQHLLIGCPGGHIT